MIIFIAGMTRSGKSEYAEHRAFALGRNMQKVYIATAEIRDSEMMRRVELHKARRAEMGFMTIERSHDLGSIDLPECACVLLESLSVWLANEMFTCSGVNHNAGEKVYEDFLALSSRAGHIVVVSDDIFSDGRKYDELTEEYLRMLGGLHVKIAALADEVIECISGIPVQYSIISKNL